MAKIKILQSDLNYQFSNFVLQTFTNILSITVGSTGQISNVTTGSISLGQITSVSGTANQIVVSPTTGIPQIDLATTGSGVNTYSNPLTITSDSFGRITSVTTSSVVPAGTYQFPVTMSVDARGRITSLTTASTITTSTPTVTNCIFTGTTAIQQQTEAIYIIGGTPSGAITLEATSATNFYMTPGGNFNIIINDLNAWMSGVTTNINLIVNNTGGYSSTTAPAFTSASWSGKVSFGPYNRYVNGALPSGTAGRIEIYSISYRLCNHPSYSNATWLQASMASFG